VDDILIVHNNTMIGQDPLITNMNEVHKIIFEPTSKNNKLINFIDLLLIWTSLLKLIYQKPITAINYLLKSSHRT